MVLSTAGTFFVTVDWLRLHADGLHPEAGIPHEVQNPAGKKYTARWQACRKSMSKLGHQRHLCRD